MLTVSEIKNDLHRLVVETDDADILSRVRAFFASLKNGTDWWDELTGEEINLIEEGERQLDAGEITSHSEVRSKIAARLGQLP